MKNALKAAKALNEAFLSSREYEAYKRAAEKLDGCPEYKDMVERFRKRQLEHEIAKVNGETGEDEFALSNDYADICLIEECNDFFQAELQFLALVKGAFDAACDGVEI